MSEQNSEYPPRLIIDYQGAAEYGSLVGGTVVTVEMLKRRARLNGASRLKNCDIYNIYREYFGILQLAIDYLRIITRTISVDMGRGRQYQIQDTCRSLAQTVDSTMELILLGYDTQAKVMYRFYLEQLLILITLISDKSFYSDYTKEPENDDNADYYGPYTKHWHKTYRLRRLLNRINAQPSSNTDMSLKKLVKIIEDDYSWLSLHAHVSPISIALGQITWDLRKARITAVKREKFNINALDTLASLSLNLCVFVPLCNDQLNKGDIKTSAKPRDSSVLEAIRSILGDCIVPLAKFRYGGNQEMYENGKI